MFITPAYRPRSPMPEVWSEPNSVAEPEPRSQSADDHLGQATGIGALSLIFRGLIHVHGAPNAHARSGRVPGDCDALGHAFGIFGHVLTDLPEGDGGVDYFRSKQPDSGHAQAGDGEAKGRNSGKRSIDIHRNALSAKNLGDICLHVASYGGSDAAQEGDEVDGDDSAEQVDDAPAEIHGLVGRVAHET